MMRLHVILFIYVTGADILLGITAKRLHWQVLQLKHPIRNTGKVLQEGRKT
jgi:hypothetical protein